MLKEEVLHHKKISELYTSGFTFVHPDYKYVTPPGHLFKANPYQNHSSWSNG